MKKTNCTKSAEIQKPANVPVWIETTRDRSGKRILNIGSEWGCDKGFSKPTAKKLFEAVSAAVKSVIPNADINPWSDAKHGTPDFN